MNIHDLETSLIRNPGLLRERVKGTKTTFVRIKKQSIRTWADRSGRDQMVNYAIQPDRPIDQGIRTAVASLKTECVIFFQA